MATDRSETEPFIIVILGCTGTGKSKLSLEIGRRIGGEIISADSMQVYKGLDIITNKVTAEERAIIPHHLLDFVDANDKFSVVEFKTIALDVISDILARQKVPIIVGGTNYYIESLLWEHLIDERNDGQVEGEQIRSKFRKVENEERNEHDRVLEANTQTTFVEEGGNVYARSRKAENEKRNKDDGARKANTESTIGVYKSSRGGEEGGNTNSRSCKVENEEWNEDDSARETESTFVECGRNSTEQNPKRAEIGSLETSFKEETILTENSSNTCLAQEAIDAESLGRGILPCPSEDSMDSISLHEQLAKVDSAMAQKLHPNDTRKIKRSLQIYEQSGITHSDHIAQQQSQAGSSEYSGPMRFKNVCVLWLQCEFETLDKRLDARVDQMIEQGLVKELVDFYISWKSESTNSKMQNNEGIFQSIGFKEFREFLNVGNSKVEESSELFKKCAEAMKCTTRRYARRQVRWVNNRFLGRPSTSSPDVYGLDATDLGQWECNVFEKALDIVISFRIGQNVTHAPLERFFTSAEAKHTNHTCTVCNRRVIIGDQNWAAHLRSRSHRHYRKKQQKFEEKSA